MNLQQIFDQATAAVIAQGVPSVQPEGGVACRYRQNMNASDPVRCAVGHLIPDEVYNPDMDEGDPLSYVLQQIGLQHFEPELRSLQSAHDEASEAPDFLVAFKARARQVYKAHGLAWNF